MDEKSREAAEKALRLLNEAMEGAGFSSVRDPGGLSGGFAADTTKEQRERDKKVTELLKTYVEAYKKKVDQSSLYRKVILWPCMGIIVAFAAMLAVLSCWLIVGGAGLKMTDVASFITACVSFLTLIIGVLHIITKYFFPEDDEKYITQIVEAIQKNDLENRKETARQAERGRSDDPGPEREAPKPATLGVLELRFSEKPESQ